MTLGGTFYIGWHYLRRHRSKAALLTAAITLSLFLPIGIMLVVQQAEHHLRARSVATPLLLGAPGSPLELVFNGVYFSEPEVATITAGAGWQATGNGLGATIPIHARFSARGYRIVGTSVEYFEFRGLRPSAGGLVTRLGDCVLGAAVAKDLGLGPGDTIVSTPEQVFDLAGVYPLKMRITGVLAPTGTMDDRAVFVDLYTAWIIEGLAHGHEDAAAGDATVLEDEGGNLQLNASIVEYTEVTDANVNSFHFHGSADDFPITAAIIVPNDSKSETLLLGHYVGEDRRAQLVRPDDVMANLFATVFQIRNVVVVALVAVGVMAAGIAVLVFMLSNRLRAREFDSLASIGADRGSVRLLLLFEGGFVVVTSVLLTAALVLLLQSLLPRLLPLLTG